MLRMLAAPLLLAAAVSALAASSEWNGSGWYAIPLDPGGWLTGMRGPISDLGQCRQTATEATKSRNEWVKGYDDEPVQVEYLCVNLTSPPEPDLGGYVKIPSGSAVDH